MFLLTEICNIQKCIDRQYERLKDLSDGNEDLRSDIDSENSNGCDLYKTNKK